MSVEPRWSGLAVVAAPGPSLTEEVAAAVHGRRVIAVTEAWRRVPFADVLYACDAAWWKANAGCQDFQGERWSSHDDDGNKKLDVAERYGLRLVRGRDAPGFSTDPAIIHYGKNSGYQAINLAILFGATRIVLVGFDMRVVNGQRYFTNRIRSRPSAPVYGMFLRNFEEAARLLPAGVEIVNTTPGSALRAFPMVELSEVL